MKQALIFFLLPWLSAVAAPSFDGEELMAPLRLPAQLEVELQGHVGSYPQLVIRRLARALVQAVDTARSLAPKQIVPNFFFPPKDAKAFFANKKFLIILTDTSIVSVAGAELDMGNSEAHPFFMPDQAYGAAPNEGVLAIAIRVDQMALDHQLHPKPFAPLNLVRALIDEIYGFWHHVLVDPLNQIDGPEFWSPGNGWSFEVARTVIANAESLKHDSRVLEHRDALNLIAGLHASSIASRNAVLQAYPNAERPLFAIPFDLSAEDIDEVVSDSVTAAINIELYKALYLVEQLAPEYLPSNIFSLEARAAPFAQDKALILEVADSRTKGPQRRFPIRSIADVTDFNVADTYLVNGSEDAKNFAIHTTLWADHIFYDRRGELRDDRLARASVAMAIEFYGKIRRYLFAPSIDVARENMTSPRDIMREKYLEVREGLKFIQRLRESRFWNLLYPHERADFANLQDALSHHLQQVRCVLDVLSGGEPLRN